MRRLGLLLAVVVLAALGAFAAIAFFNARDDAGVETPTGTSPRRPAVAAQRRPGPGDDGGQRRPPVLRRRVARRAEALAEDIAGPPSPELEDAGQAVLVRKAAAAGGIVAIAGDRGLRVTDPGRPALRAFIEARLGAALGRLRRSR